MKGWLCVVWAIFVERLPPFQREQRQTPTWNNDNGNNMSSLALLTLSAPLIYEI